MVGRLLAALSVVLVLAGCGAWPPHPTPPSTTRPATTKPPATTTTPPSTSTPPATQPPRTACFPAPSACGYPDATTTGYKPTGAVPSAAGITINRDKVWVVNVSGVYDSKLVDGCVDVHAANVTIKRSLIKGCDSYFNIRLYPGASNFVIEDTEVDGSGSVNNAAFVDDGSGPVTMRRVDMHDVADGPHPGEHWLIVDSYIHDLTRCDICHNDTIQSAGALDVTLRHNTLVNLAGTSGPDGGMNAVVRIATEQGPVQGVLVENNLLAGGNFAAQIRSQGNGAPTGVVIKGNRVARGKTPDNQPYPRFGAWDYPDVTVRLSGNVWDDNGTAN